MRLCHRPLLIGLSLCALVVVACAPELEQLEQRRSPRGTIGVEVYKALCRRVAGTEMPLDVSGRRSEAICLGDADAVQAALAASDVAVQPVNSSSNIIYPAGTAAAALPSRLVALGQRRAAIAQAVDDMLPGELSDELEHLFRLLLPFYDTGDVQEGTRSLATVIERLVDPNDPKVLSGLARVGRKGMLPREGNLGFMRGTLGASGVRDMARSFLPLTADDPAVRSHYDTVMSGLALELATIEVDAPPDSDIQQLKRLLLRSHPDFGSGTPLFGSVRDSRGLPIPVKRGNEVPFPFVDADANGVADADGSQLLVAPTFTGRLPEPFSTTGEGPVVRDSFGRAHGISLAGASDATRLLYESQDADSTLLAGVLRTVQKLFRNDDLTYWMALLGPSIVGEHAPTTAPYGKLNFPYAAPNPVASPLLDLVHGSTALLDQPVTPASLALTKTIIDTEEAATVAAIEPLLTLERRTRPGSDAYPEAKLKAGHTFWDELFFELEKLSRRRVTKDGETLLEALMRGSLGYGRNLQKPGAPVEQLVDPELLRHQGVVLSTLMRFKDEWRANPTGESDRQPGEAVVLGSFRTPVDRSQPDSPVTCGRDGCGGPIAGTVFERWRKPEQNCMAQRQGRPQSGKDCGQPANQSLLQRSLGLIAEMAGRSQCNKPISIGDLLDFAVLKDPCVGDIIPDSPECEALRRQQRLDRASSVESAEDQVRDDYACPDQPDAPCKAYAAKYPATFVDPDGPDGSAPASIQACHMIDLPDTGRTYGAAVTHEFQLEFPNPWVRRYLEDIARAALVDTDPDGDGIPLVTCDRYPTPDPPEPYRITDPTVTPPCVPGAAKLSRDIYEDMPPSVDTLGELVEFLLDDTQLFVNDEDTRELRPDVKALSRVLFAPAGSASFILFDPLLVHGAPPACAVQPALPVCDNNDAAVTPPGGCCIKDLTRPPLRYRMDDYGATSFAWEQPIRLTDGKTISFIDTMKSLSDAVARFDYDAKRGDDPSLFEDTSYVFSSLGKLIAEHYDSEANPTVQARDPKAENYRRLTGLVRYERMVADAADDEMIDPAQLANDGLPLFDPKASYTPEQKLGVLYHSLPLVQVLDRLSVDGGADGIDLSAEVTELMLSPHARCAGATGDRRVIAGQGACDRQARGEPGLVAPFTYRDGRSHICWEDGRCFDGQTQPKRFASPLYVLLDSLAAIDDRIKKDPALDAAFNGLIAGLIDTYGTTSNRRFDDRKVRALLVSMLDHMRERITEERGAGTLATLAARTNEDAREALHNPVIAGVLGLSTVLTQHRPALSDLRKYTYSTLSESGPQNNLRPLIAGLFDMVQLLPGDADSNAALRAMAVAFSSKVEAAVAGEPVALDPQLSAVGRNMYMLRQTAVRDTAEPSVLERVLNNAARVPEGRPSALEVILDAAVEINRVRPGEEVTPSAEDLRVALVRIAQVLRDPRRGFERLYQIVRCTRRGPSEPGCE